MYRSLNVVKAIKSRRLRWAGNVVRTEEGRNTFKILSGKPTGKRTLEKPRRRWEENIRQDLKEISINMKIGLIRLRLGITGEPFWMQQ